MRREAEYIQRADPDKVRKYGQFFTDDSIAGFMAKWIGCDAHTVLDPALGNSVFFRLIRQYNPLCTMVGYEIDPAILDFFGNPTGCSVKCCDYMLDDWDRKYDAIICNPPYNRFQAIDNRDLILETVRKKTGIPISGYTNQAILFLIKSIYQMSECGRVAYIVPSEFLNSAYGTAVKELMRAQRLLRALINFKKDTGIFYQATTTCCILLLDKEPKEKAEFINVAGIGELRALAVGTKRLSPYSRLVDYKDLNAEDKWKKYLYFDLPETHQNLVPVKTYCTISRSIATGANRFFCFNQSKIMETQIPQRFFSKCIRKSADVQGSVLTDQEMERLAGQNKYVYLLDTNQCDDANLSRYLEEAKGKKIDQKYLLKGRNPWFSMEEKPIAPIWISSACREKIKVIRNLAQVKTLTTFHSVFVNPEFSQWTDIIFCYLLTPTGQHLLKKNRKELGGGLTKFQPRDLNDALMIHLQEMSLSDISAVRMIYNELSRKESPKLLDALDDIFSAYINK